MYRSIYRNLPTAPLQPRKSQNVAGAMSFTYSTWLSDVDVLGVSETLQHSPPIHPLMSDRWTEVF